MANRQQELLEREYTKKAERFLYIIQGYYQLRKQPPNIQEMLKVSNLVLFCQGNREAAKEFFKQTTKEPMLTNYLDFMDAVDKALADANPKGDPVLEQFLIYRISGLAIKLMISTYPIAKIDINVGGTNGAN